MSAVEFDIVHVKQLGGTRFMGYAIQVHADMIQEEQAGDRHLNLHWETEGVFAVQRGAQDDEGRIIGMITFSEEKWRKVIYVGLGFVTRRFRNEGIYRQLWNKLVELAQDRDVPSISGTTHSDNETMLAVAKKLGRRETGIVLEFDVPKKT